MHFIKKSIKNTTLVFFLCLGIAQTQNKITPIILLENSEITNRKNEFYALEKGSLKLFTISATNKYKQIWEYKFSVQEGLETISVLYGDISGNGEKEVVVLNHIIGAHSSLYVFQTKNKIPTGSPEIFKLKSEFNKTKPIEAKLLRWDADKDMEIIISFGSPERKIVIIDYIIDTIKIVDNIAKEFLLNSYGPINLEISDKNNDKIDDVYIYSNSTQLEKYIHISSQSSAERETRSMTDKKINYFLVYKDKKESREIALVNNDEIYMFNTNAGISLLNKTEKIYHLKNNRFLLLEAPNIIGIIDVDTAKKATKKIHESRINTESQLEHIVSENKQQILFYNQETKQINLIDLTDPYREYSADPQPLQAESLINIKDLNKQPIKEEKTKNQKTEQTDTLIVNAEESIEILIPKISGYIFQDLETIKRPENIKLSLEKLSFIWVPTNADAGHHSLEYNASYNSKPKLEENKINNQLVVSVKSEEKKITEKTTIYVNGLPKLIISTIKDTIPVNSDLEAEYNIEDPNKKDQHSIKVINQKPTNPLVINNNSIFWKPQKEDAGINIFNLEVSDGKAKTIHPFKIFVDTTKKENIYTEKLNATTNTEFVFQLPHTKGNKYELVKKPENLRITKTGQIYWIPLITQIDGNIVEILITNKLDINKHVLEIYVNSPPIISYRPAIEEHLKFGEKLHFICQSFDMNKDAKLGWQLTDNKNKALAISDYGKITLADTTQIDNILYKLELSDEIDSDIFDGIFYINTQPEFISTPNEYIALGDTFTYLLEAKDKNMEKPFSPKEPNELFYKIIFGPEGSKINQNNTLVWIPKTENLGKNNFLFEVTDSLATNNQEVVVFVNDKPSITSIDSLSIELGDTLKHLFFVEDLNQNSEFSYNIKTTLDEILFSRKTGTLTWVPSESDIGLHNLEISVSDGFTQSADTQKLKIYVYKRPALLNSPKEEAFVNVEYFFEPKAMDMYNKGIINADIFVEFNNADTLLSIQYDKNTNILSWIPSLNEIGTHSFTLNITDKDKHTTTEQFDIQVILSPCENTDTLFNNNIDTVYQTIIDSVFIKQIDTLTINRIDTVSQIQIDSIFIEKTDTIKILIDESGKEVKKKKQKTTNITYDKSAFDRNNPVK